jgi:hypothetical protein
VFGSSGGVADILLLSLKSVAVGAVDDLELHEFGIVEERQSACSMRADQFLRTAVPHRAVDGSRIETALEQLLPQLSLARHA